MTIRLVLASLIITLCVTVSAQSVEVLIDPFLPGLELGNGRETVKEALQDEGYKLSWDEWCLWGTRDDIYDIAYCFGEYGELKSIEYHQRCPGDTWTEVTREWHTRLVDIFGPSRSTEEEGPKYWSTADWEVEMGQKYTDEADGLDTLIYIYITD